MADERALGREFRAWFREQIDREQLTQAEAAVELGVHPSTVTKWCSKQPPLPSYVQLVHMRERFGSLPLSLAPDPPSASSGTEDASER